jgi:AhpD family alkylhydroperoxidase
MSTHLSHFQVKPQQSKTFERRDIYSKEILLEPKLLELVRLRVAQICHCQLCVEHHTQTLVDQGESENRVEHLESWRASALYSDRERTALAVAEALGSIPPKPVSKAIIKEARAHFNGAEILQLTLTIFAVNDWNYRCTHHA